MEDSTVLPEQKHTSTHLNFTEDHLHVPQHYWNNAVRTDETTVELIGKSRNLAYQHQNLSPMGKLVEKYNDIGLLCCFRVWMVCEPMTDQIIPDSTRTFKSTMSQRLFVLDH